MSSPDSTDDLPPDAGSTRSDSPARRSAVLLAATLVGCGLVGLTVSYLFESVGAIESALALAVGLLIFRQGRALTRTNRSLREQVVMRERAQDSGRTSQDELSRILASVEECWWCLRIAPDGRVEKDFISPAIEGICGYPPEQIRTPTVVASSAARAVNVGILE